MSATSLTPSHPSGGSPVPERKPTFDTTTNPSHKHIAYNHPSTYNRQPSPTSQRTTTTETDYDDKLNLIVDYYYNNLELIAIRKPYTSIRYTDTPTDSMSTGDRRTDPTGVRPSLRLGSADSVARIELPRRRRIADWLLRNFPTRSRFARPSVLSDWINTRQMVRSISEHQRSSVALSRARHTALAILTEEAR